MRILALDIGTKMGYAIYENGAISFGTFDFTPKRFEGNGMRFIRFMNALEEIKPDIVFFEEIRRHLGIDAAHCYGGFLSHLQVYCDKQDPKIPYGGITVADVKRIATGKGRADKKQMVEAVKTMGYEVKDDNQADAICILLHALKNIVKGTENV